MNKYIKYVITALAVITAPFWLLPAAVLFLVGYIFKDTYDDIHFWLWKEYPDGTKEQRYYY